jgi:hypothetical protein
VNEIDLGHDHFLQYFRWAPDDLPGNRELYGVPLPNVDKAGASIRHKTKTGEECRSAVTFDIPEVLLMRRGGNVDVWKVESWEPLTLSPSLLCRRCGDHGHIRDGKWVPA